MVEERIDGLTANLTALSQRTPAYSSSIDSNLPDITGERDIIPGYTLLDIVSRNALLIKLHLNSTGRIIYLRHYILQLLLIENAKGCIAQGILAHSTHSYRMQAMLTCVVSEVGRSTAELRTTRENIKEDFAQTYTIFCIQILCFHNYTLLYTI